MSSINSLVQPGRHIPDEQLLPELPGSLTNLRRVDSVGCSEFTDLYVGVWEQPDRSKTAVAVKCFRNFRRDLFGMRIKREAVIWRDVNHPNILQFLGYKEIGQFPSLVSPWCQHGNITEFIDKNPGLTDIKKLELLCGAARGLEYLHSRTPAIVHCNIIPQSVIVQDNLEAALSDPGLPRVLALWGSFCLTDDPWIGRDERYRSQQFFLEGSRTAADDVYGFGGLTLVTMSGKRPFWKKRNSLMCLQAIINGQTPSPIDHPGLPEADPLWSFLQACWSRDPENRPTSNTVLQKLERTLKERLAHSTCLMDE